jgi:hypothetical protein
MVSCSAVMGKIYGIRNIDQLNTDTILNAINKNETLRNHENYFVDSTYLKGVYSKLSDDTNYAVHLYQPIQAMYFDTMGQLVSYHINCNAGGFPNLKWNRHNAFNIYPPVTQTPCSDKITYSLIGPYLNGLTGEGIVSTKREKVVIFWSTMMYKQSESLIALVMQNLKATGKESSVEVQFVNTDCLYKNEKHL